MFCIIFGGCLLFSFVFGGIGAHALLTSTTARLVCVCIYFENNNYPVFEARRLQFNNGFLLVFDFEFTLFNGKNGLRFGFPFLCCRCCWMMMMMHNGVLSHGFSFGLRSVWFACKNHKNHAYQQRSEQLIKFTVYFRCCSLNATQMFFFTELFSLICMTIHTRAHTYNVLFNQ